MNTAEKMERVTIEEFEAMEKDERFNYELIDGVVMMSPRPTMTHQNISGNIYHELRNILKGNNCKPILEIELVLKNNTFVPDILVICNDDFKGKRYEKPPLIAIEVISLSSASRDHITKRHQYEQLCIKEYWIVSPDEKCITVINFLNNQQEMYCEGQMRSFVLPEIQIDLADIFS